MYPAERVQTNLRKGVLEWCALAVIGRGDVYGRDLARTLTDLGLLAGEGTLYPLLTRLRESGWVETRWAESPGGPPRRYYRITAAGRAAVDAFEQDWARLSLAVADALGTPDPAGTDQPDASTASEPRTPADPDPADPDLSDPNPAPAAPEPVEETRAS